VSYSNKDLVAFRINKAKETFRDAQLLLEAMRWDSAANRLYYASFYMVSAYMAKQEIRVTTHSGIKSRFNQELIKTGKIEKELGVAFNKLFAMRQDADYEDFEEIDEKAIQPMAAQVQKLLDQLEKLLQD
jgi:uncharacterized protein (UPF0332 family)